MVDRPNVLILLADDLGFSDIEPFGGEMDTPHLTRLAAEGVRMSSFYVTPRCSPSRAALLTGRDPHALGIGVLTTDNGPGGYPGTLDVRVPTLARLLQDEGYTTGLFGKWHLSSDVSAPNDSWPTRRGFTEFRGILQGSSGYFRPRLVAGERILPEAEIPRDMHLTEDISQHTADFARRCARAGEPFLAVAAFTAPHWPLHARAADVDACRDRYRGGWEAVRAARREGLRRRGLDAVLGDVDAALPELPPWGENADWETERMAVYAAQVQAMDRGIGQVLDALERMGVRERTLVLFLSDNGGCAEELGPATEHFPRPLEPRTTRDGDPVRIGNDPRVIPGPADTFQSYGRTWATVSNTPFRRWKRWVHEGGISSPFIASWPDGGLGGGEVRADTLGHITDLVPTVLEAVGAPGPEDPQVAGTSLLGSLREGGHRGPERTLCWEHTGHAAIRRGAHKLVREWPGPWELYDLDHDRTESRDLAPQQPELVAQLEQEYERWSRENGVIPWQDMIADHVSRGLPPEAAAS